MNDCVSSFILSTIRCTMFSMFQVFAIKSICLISITKDLASVRNVIVWLEDRLIRALPAESRLRDVQSLEWTSYLNKVCAFSSFP